MLMQTCIFKNNVYIHLFIYKEDLDVLIETFTTNRKGKHNSVQKIPGNLI